jgi:hypothetical protein
MSLEACLRLSKYLSVLVFGLWFSLGAYAQVPAPVICAGLDNLENRIVISSDDSREYLITHGQRHWIVDPRWTTVNNRSSDSVTAVSGTELRALPLGSDITYTSPQDKIALTFLTVCLSAFCLFLTSGSKYSLLLWGNRLIAKLSERRLRVLLFGAFVLIIISRASSLALHPRFWAEDGVIWFEYGSSHSPLQMLTFLYPLSGYFNLTANIGGVLSSFTAAHLGLEYAPGGTTALSLMLQVLPIAIVLFGRSRLFDSFWKAIAGCLIILFSPTATEEIWLNTINSMSYLGLMTFLLVFEDTSSWPVWLKWIFRGLLVLAGLSGAYSLAFLPLFAVSAYLYKQRETKIQSAILGACLLVQGGIVLHSKFFGAGLPTRELPRFDTAMVNVLFGHIATPSLGLTTMQNLIGGLGLTDAWESATSFTHPFSSTMLVAGWFSSLILGVLLWRLRGSGGESVRNFVLGAFLLVAGLTSVASMAGVPQARYAFLPGLLFLLLLLLNIEHARSRLIRFICMVALAFGLSNGILAYDRVAPFSGPPWSDEVQVWRKNHAYRLRVWPGWLTKGIAYCSPKPCDTESAVSPVGGNVTAKYANQLVRRPGNSPEDGKVYFVTEGQKRWVLSSDWIRAHAYNWPKDVHEISAIELNAIPTGPPILSLK